MDNNVRLYWLHALSSLHVGVGQGAGYIELPVMREKTTAWPYVPASAIKGVLADYHGASGSNRASSPVLGAAFGRSDEGLSNAGALVFTDARLVCLPVRSFYGTFAWCTSALALARFQRDLGAAGLARSLPPVESVETDAVYLPESDRFNSVLRGEDGRVYFEDLDFTSKTCDSATRWAERLAEWIFPNDGIWQETFCKRFVILPDEVFDFFCETGTEVAARVRIDEERKAVVQGNLWHEEALPAETILGGLVWCDRVFSASGTTPDQLLESFCSGSVNLQIGGKATVGKGRVLCSFVKGGGTSGKG